MESVKHLGEDYQIVAVLHDVVEDTHVTLDEVREEFGDVVADAVGSVTRGFTSKKVKEAYSVFILRAKNNVIGREVKIADIEDNTSQERLGHLSFDEQMRLIKKYRPALVALKT